MRTKTKQEPTAEEEDDEDNTNKEVVIDSNPVKILLLGTSDTGIFLTLTLARSEPSTILAEP